MPPVTFCADPPIARSVLAYLVGVPAAALASFGAYRATRGRGPRGAIRRFAARTCATVTFAETLVITLVLLGGPCVFAGGGQGRSPTPYYNTTPTTVIGAAKVALLIGVVFALALSIARPRQRAEE